MNKIFKFNSPKAIFLHLYLTHVYIFCVNSGRNWNTKSAPGCRALPWRRVRQNAEPGARGHPGRPASNAAPPQVVRAGGRHVRREHGDPESAAEPTASAESEEKVGPANLNLSLRERRKKKFIFYNLYIYIFCITVHQIKNRNKKLIVSLTDEKLNFLLK
jgi:hypothetical protein